MGRVHNDDTIQSHVWLGHQVNQMAAVLDEQITNGIRVLGILDGHLNSFHPHLPDNLQFASH
jgi:hypothetical protein